MEASRGGDMAGGEAVKVAISLEDSGCKFHLHLVSGV